MPREPGIEKRTIVWRDLAFVCGGALIIWQASERFTALEKGVSQVAKDVAEVKAVIDTIAPRKVQVGSPTVATRGEP